MKRREVNYSKLPMSLVGDARRYVEDGIPVGGFFRACLEDKLIESFSRADDENIRKMFDIASWLYNDCPMAARGTEEKVKHWIEIGGLNGIFGGEDDASGHQE